MGTLLSFVPVMMMFGQPYSVGMVSPTCRCGDDVVITCRHGHACGDDVIITRRCGLITWDDVIIACRCGLIIWE